VATPGPETKLVQKIKAAILARYPGSFVSKLHGSAYSSGMPDLLVVVRGVPCFLEVKAPRENEADHSILARVTPLQAETLKKLRSAGAVAEACWSVEQALEILDRYVPTVDRAEISRDRRLYALADAEDKLRRQLEEAETRIHELTVENNRFRSTR
jgi:hypothetical protein